MAFTYGFYNSFNHDRKYDALQFGQIFDGIIKDGVYATYKKALLVKASNNPNEVIVQPGRAWFNHTWSYNDADLPIEAPQPEVLLDRLDTLVLDINSEDETRANSIIWVQGTPTSQVPQRANLIHTVTHNQYPLCDVYRKAGTTQIYAGDIRNRIGSSDCPFVTGVLEAINVDDWLELWNTAFSEMIEDDRSDFGTFLTGAQSEYASFKSTSQSDFSNLMSTSQSSLDSLLTTSQGRVDNFITAAGAEVNDLIDDSEDDFNALFTRLETAATTYFNDSSTAWNNWFQHYQDELSSSQAANLQAQIDAISNIYVTGETAFFPGTGISVVNEKAVFTV